MCGRFNLDTDLEKLKEQFGVKTIEPLPNSSNIAPTETALCLIQKEEELTAVQMRWGIVPWYAKKKKNVLLINARVETVAEKSAFRQGLKSRRCILLMSGFFEWQHHLKNEKKVKQPYYIARADKQLMAVAAIWEPELKEPNLTFPSCCLLTSTPNSIVAQLHDRMPWILSEEQQKQWLAPKQFSSSSDLEHILKQEIDIELNYYPVTQAVNSALYKEKDTVIPLKTNL